MASLVERLRDRSDRKPLYNIDDSDDDFDLDVRRKPSRAGSSGEKVEKTQRPDVKEGSCQACGKDGDILNCETCTYSYHPKCLFPPLRGPLPSSWKCPQCVGPLIDIEKILDCEMRPIAGDEEDASKQGSDQVPVKHYLVKWKGQSYLHCTWVPETEFINAYKLNPRLRTRVNNFRKQASSTDYMEDEYAAIRPEWTTVDRIIACREGDEEKEYLVKWKELSYEECYWELESDIATFHEEIEKFNRNKSRRGKASVAKQKSKNQDAVDSKQKQKEFQQYDSSPEFLSGGILHPYQLDGLNFLRFSWSKQTHVILADEMGLGKTIQSIAFLASLFVENVAPHLVVAPLSTLRNWEREFALWAPHMNVVMYVGSAQARNVIQEYEFYYPKTHMKAQKKSKKKFGQTSNESKQERIKFDVLLTSYEMINLDSAALKPIKWECMIVDEGHRLKNKDSKLFSMLTQFSSKHRVLLTGTPLQNNLDELFMLMHFLDAGKFANLEEFQNEFKDINQEEQISRLHSMLAPHLLRRMKKDVLKGLPPKKELILRVELSSKQKEYYKAILTRNYEILARKGGGQISLINVVMELRKLCCHPFMLEGVEPENTKEFNMQLVECSGKLQLLDKMMVKLKEQGHRVLIYSQFQHMLNLLEDYCSYRKWNYERIDGTVGGVERQIRIDRFNANNSSKFCFLLSTRAGGIGINLASADTVVIYDSDWNPHADLQAMARAHRLGQTNKVMIYRLVLRGTIEERMMELTKKKMVLEHIVVGKLKTQNINQEELDDIIRYGSMELFADDNDELVKSRQIHYDDAAIDSLLDREQDGVEDALLDDKEEDGFLKAFKVANFEYVDEVEAAAEEESSVAQADNRGSANNSEQANYWEDLLRDKYEVHKIEEFNAMGKGKRSRKQVVQVEEHGLAGFRDVSSDSEDDNYGVELIDGETSTGAASAKKSNRKRAIDVKDIPLMEGEGKSLKVLGFNQSQRAQFVKTMMRFGAGDYEWGEFIPRLKKTFEEVHHYGKLFLEHLVEAQSDLPTFIDGVPKEGLQVPDILVRIAVMNNIFNKVKASTDGSVHFADDILSLYPPLRGGRFWTPKHDLTLLQAVLKHGYQRWQGIVDDKESGIQEAICQHLSLPVPTTSHTQHTGVGTSSQPQTHGVNLGQNQSKETTVGNESASGSADHTAPPAQMIQNQPVLLNTKDVQRRLVDFIKKRLWLLERAMAVEWVEANEVQLPEHNMPTAETGHNVEGANCSFPVGSSTSAETGHNVEDANWPPAETFSYDEVMAFASDQNPDRLKTAELYNKMNMLITNNAQDSLGPLESIFQEMNKILAPSSKEDNMTGVENLGPTFTTNTGAGSSAMDTDATVDNMTGVEILGPTFTTNTGAGSSAMDTDATAQRNPSDAQMNNQGPFLSTYRGN